MWPSLRVYATIEHVEIDMLDIGRSTTGHDFHPLIDRFEKRLPLGSIALLDAARTPVLRALGDLRRREEEDGLGPRQGFLDTARLPMGAADDTAIFHRVAKMIVQIGNDLGIARHINEDHRQVRRDR